MEKLKNSKKLSDLKKLKIILSKRESSETPIGHLVKKVLATFVGLYLLIFLLIFRYSYWLQRHILFSHFVRWPLYVDFNKPEKFDLKGVKNFYLSTKDGVKLGVWQILPNSYATDNVNPETFNSALGDGRPIVVYVHGNSGNRASYHRRQLYKILQTNQCHIIAFDYRCFGDSSYVSPDEAGLVEDTATVLRWVMEKKQNSPVYVWGHSLGTAVGSRAATELEKNNQIVNGLILESPFNNLEDAIRNHFLSSFLGNMIGFDYFVIKPVQQNGLTFKTDVYLATSKIPLFIMHSSDDWVLPSRLGKKLFDYLLLNRPKAEENVKFVEFGSGGYGHKNICNAPILIELINSFLAGKLDEIPAYID